MATRATRRTAATPPEPRRVLDAAAHSVPGSNHDVNEDRAHAGTVLFALADGMGGHRAGDVAAETALAAVRMAEAALSDHVCTAEELRAVIEAANDDVRERARRDQLEGMGTTLTTLAIHGDAADVAWAGDTRAYRLRGDDLQQLTSDHSAVRRLVDQGVLDPEDVDDDPRRNMITRAVGIRDDARPDVTSLHVRPADRLLICSDGVTDVLDDATIAALVGSTPDAATAAQDLVDAAVRAGTTDDATALVVVVVA